MKQKRILTLMAGMALLILAGCTPADESSSPSVSAPSSGPATSTGSTGLVPDSIGQVLAGSLAPNYSQEDLVWDPSSEITVTLSDSGSTGGQGVAIDGTVVTITRPGNYRVSGTLTNGQLAVDGTGLVRLILDRVSITNNSSSALVAKGVDKLVIITAEDTTSTLTDATTYIYPDPATTEPDAALFSSVDTVLGGDGDLVVNGRATDAITSKDGLVIASGTLDVTAVDDGIKGRDYLVVSDGIVTVTAGGQGLKSTQDSDDAAGYILVSGGTIDVTTTGESSDCVNAITRAMFTGGALTLSCTDDAIHADKLVMMEGGEITVTDSYEGLESAAVVLAGGKLDVTSTDDTINATDGSGVGNPGGGAGGPGGTPGFGGGRGPGTNPGGTEASGGNAGRPGGGGAGGGGFAVENATVDIRGGEITLNAGGDGIDSNGTIVISGGTTIASGANRAGDGALDSNGSLTVTGGTVAAIGGSSRMLRTPDEASPQQWFSQDAAINAGDVIIVTTHNGTFTFTAAKQAQNLVFTSPDLAPGASFTVGGASPIVPECHGG